MTSWTGRNPRRRRARGRWGWALATGALLLLLVALLVQPVRVGIQTLLLLPTAFPWPLDPLAALTPPPTRTEHAFSYAAGVVEADVYHPATPGRHGGVVLLLGARPVPRREAVLVRFAEGLSRLGVVVLVPESNNLLDGRILPQEREALVRSFRLLLEQPRVDAERAGFVGFSVGGALAVLASAAEPELRDRVRFVNSLGAYYDAAELLVDFACRCLDTGSAIVAWEPSPLTYQVLATQLIETLPVEEERALLTRAYLEGVAVDEAALDGLSGAAAVVRQLLTGVPRELALQLIPRLPPATLERLTATSPSTYIAELRARLYLMHDLGDSYIPYTQSRRLAAAAPPGTLQRYTEFSIFQHVLPDRPVPWDVFLPDLWKLYWHLHAVLIEVL